MLRRQIEVLLDAVDDSSSSRVDTEMVDAAFEVWDVWIYLLHLPTQRCRFLRQVSTVIRLKTCGPIERDRTLRPSRRRS